MTTSPSKPRLLTGDRPTGRLHLGHYVGSLANRVKLQHEYDAFFIIADLHTLTTKPEREFIRAVPHYIRDAVLDYLAVGLDPELSTIFVQSAIPETYELNLLFEMLVSVPRLERLPSLKDMARDADLDSMPFGLLGYPVLQAVDILLPRAELVPVGKDNQAHVELALGAHLLADEVLEIEHAQDIVQVLFVDREAAVRAVHRQVQHLRQGRV